MKISSVVMVGLLGIASAAAQKRTASELIALAQAHSPDLRAAIEASFEARDLKEGTAWLGRGPEFLLRWKLHRLRR